MFQLKKTQLRWVMSAWGKKKHGQGGGDAQRDTDGVDDERLGSKGHGRDGR